MDHLHRCKTSFWLVDGSGLFFLDFVLCLQGGNLMFAADCPTKRAAFMTDMTLGRWSHVPAFPIIVNGNRLSLCSPVSQNPINLKINLFVKKM